MMMIDVRNVKKSFGALRVLQGVTFSIARGEALSIIGASGGGKSVLLKLLIGLMSQMCIRDRIVPTDHCVRAFV